MTNDPAPNQSPTAALFQKAHSRMTMLQRLDEQLAGLMDQRRKLQEELRAIQGQINEEFDRLTRPPADSPFRPQVPGGTRPPEPRGLLDARPTEGQHDEGPPVIPRIEGVGAFRS